MGKLLSRSVALALLLAGLMLARGPGEADLAAQDKAALPPDLARISGRSHALVSIRPADLWDGELGKGVRAKIGKDVEQVIQAFEREIGLAPAGIERLTLVMSMVAQGVEPVFFVAAKQAIDKDRFLKGLVPGGMMKKHNDRDYYANDRRAVAMIDDRHYILGSVGDVQTALDNWKAKPEGSLVPALKLAAGKHAAVLAANPEGIASNVNVTADAEAFKPMFRSTLTTMTFDVSDKAKGQLRMTFPGADDAKEGLKAADLGRGMLVESLGTMIKLWEKDAGIKGVVGLMKDLHASMKSAKLTQKGTTLAADVEVNLQKDAAVVAAEAVVRMREAAKRMQSVNNLKQIALALHNYESSFNNMPPAATYDKDGKPLLSWRVLILPFIEQDALYKEFKLDEAWDSPHNKKLLEKMPKVYQIPEGKPQHKYGTFYQVFHGVGAGFEGKRGIRFADFTDGTSNTFLVAEAGKDVPWTKPEDMEFDAGKDVPKLGGHFAGGFNVGFADGSVRFIKDSLDKTTLKALITRNGGEVIAGGS